MAFEQMWSAQARRADGACSPPKCLIWLRIFNRATWSTAFASTRVSPRLCPRSGTLERGYCLKIATMSKLLWMLLVIGSAWADDDGRIHPKCVEENNTRRCWVERPATPSPADHGALVPVRPPPSPQSSLPPQPSLPPPSSVQAPPNRRPPLIFRVGPLVVRIR